jgi:hypothetical protein
VLKPLLVLMKPAAARQFHDAIAISKPGGQIEQQFQQFDQHRTGSLAPKVNQTPRDREAAGLALAPAARGELAGR